MQVSYIRIETSPFHRRKVLCTNVHSSRNEASSKIGGQIAGGDGTTTIVVDTDTVKAHKRDLDSPETIQLRRTNVCRAEAEAHRASAAFGRLHRDTIVRVTGHLETPAVQKSRLYRPFSSHDEWRGT